MRTAMISIIAIHGLFHLSGFLKAFGMVGFSPQFPAVSKTFGILSLITFLLFACTVVLNVRQSDHWWICGLLAVIVSQVLIIRFWPVAKFGTLANVVILLSVSVAYSTLSFKNQINEERLRIFAKAETGNHQIITRESMKELPPIVQKWLTISGLNEKRMISDVYLSQELQLKLKPEQKDWYSGTAEQYFTVFPPAFSWSIDTRMTPFLPVAGRDKFEDGKGEMLIRLFSLIPVADAKNDPKVNEATLQRYLAEIVWFPSAAVSPFIKWEAAGANKARATMEYAGTRGSGEFYFDEKGEFKKFVALRYRDANAVERTEWAVVAQKTETRNGIKIPVECRVSWKVNNEQWTWLNVKINEIDYNVIKKKQHSPAG